MDIILWNDDQGRVVAFTPPGGVTAEQAKADEAYTPQDRPTFIKDNGSLPSAPLAAWRLSDQGVVTTIELPDPVPAEVRSGQLIKALHAAKKLEAVKAVVAAAGGLAADLWAHASIFDRDDPLIDQLGTAAGMTAEEIDDVFRAAAKF